MGTQVNGWQPREANTKPHVWVDLQEVMQTSSPLGQHMDGKHINDV